jgi:hypothetical protein
MRHGYKMNQKKKDEVLSEYDLAKIISLRSNGIPHGDIFKTLNRSSVKITKDKLWDVLFLIGKYQKDIISHYDTTHVSPAEIKLLMKLLDRNK